MSLCTQDMLRHSALCQAVGRSHLWGGSVPEPDLLVGRLSVPSSPGELSGLPTDRLAWRAVTVPAWRLCCLPVALMEGCGRLCPSLGTQGPHFLGIHCSPRIFVMSLSHVNSPKDSGLDSRPERIRVNFSFLPCHVHSSRVHEPLCSLQGKHEGKQTLKRCAGQDAPTVQEGAEGTRPLSMEMIRMPGHPGLAQPTGVVTWAELKWAKYCGEAIEQEDFWD